MQKTAYGMRISDWSSDVCSSDLGVPGDLGLERVRNLLFAAVGARDLRGFHRAGRPVRHYQASGSRGGHLEISRLEDRAALVEGRAGDDIAIAPLGDCPHLVRNSMTERRVGTDSACT